MFEYQYPDVHGHFGRYGGSFASETLTHALTELREAYAKYQNDPNSSPNSSPSWPTT
jgi:tryptophan synthase beta chain